ncbi:MAG: MvaI/BcnI family restriction endonuclease [Pseudomonadota bacterium]
MPDNAGTYDSINAQQIGLDALLDVMGGKGVDTVFIKKLAPNDNSKNQPYFGFHLTDLPFIPTGSMEASETTSQKSRSKGRDIKYQAAMKLSWIDVDSNTYPAPHAKLIYYPQYPEVRFSGFLRGSQVDLSRWMAPEKQGRAEGRWLLLGVNEAEASVFGFLATPDSALAIELAARELTPTTNIFSEIGVNDRTTTSDTRAALLQKLLEIHLHGWIPGQKLGKDRQPRPYKALNGGGYTLEAMLGISPNGVAEPDYLGWEVKQFGVKALPRNSAKPTTLMTPEPNGGFYVVQGAIEFVRRFGYPDKSGKPDRLNFGGKHIVNKECAATELTMRLDGFDPVERQITEANGAISLTSNDGTVTASWSFAKVMDHWKRKHSQAVYIPCLMRKAQSGVEYHYGSSVELGVGTDFEMFLSAMLDGVVYYDPGIKLERASTETPTIKRRSQFRVNHRHLKSLYRTLEFVDIVQ